MDQSSFSSRRHDEPDFDLKEWSLLKAQVSRENTNSRRFSTSNLRSFREDAKSFRSNITTISSTASSPGYTIRGEIDPSTYSFTTALKALQAKTMYRWAPEGVTLNSKWNDAEKYICNPLSGQVPLECLSSKTLNERPFRSRITMSAPLIYPSHLQQQNEVKTIIQEKKSGTTKDVGTQSTPMDLSSSSPSPAPTPSIEERSIKHRDSPVFSGKSESEKEVEVLKVTEEDKYTKRNEGEEREHKKKKKKKKMCMWMCCQERGCLSSLTLSDLRMRRRQRGKHKLNKPQCQ
ncbi:hypothetical protein ACJIZ3_002265 [Penstemon smallii]|uniref:Uncharacterized protein n=1 Tax=Penstemon smallii TaxID=265156 RepID=A0ABD3U604_9LAMI